MLVSRGSALAVEHVAGAGVVVARGGRLPPPHAGAGVAEGRVDARDAPDRDVARAELGAHALADAQLVDTGDVGAVGRSLVLDADRHGGARDAGPGRPDVVVRARTCRYVGGSRDVHVHGHALAGRQAGVGGRRERDRVVRGVDVVRPVAVATRRGERATGCEGRRRGNAHHGQRDAQHGRPDSHHSLELEFTQLCTSRFR